MDSNDDNVLSWDEFLQFFLERGTLPPIHSIPTSEYPLPPRPLATAYRLGFGP